MNIQEVSFENAVRNNEKIDKSNAGRRTLPAVFYLPTPNLKVDMTLSYEYSGPGGYPYKYTSVTEGEETRPEYIGKIANNERSSYRRGLLNSGVNIEYQARTFILKCGHRLPKPEWTASLIRTLQKKTFILWNRNKEQIQFLKRSYSNQSRRSVGNGQPEFPDSISGYIQAVR